MAINEQVHSSNLLNLTIATAKNETAKNKNELYFLFKNLVNDFVAHDVEQLATFYSSRSWRKLLTRVMIVPMWITPVSTLVREVSSM